MTAYRFCLYAVANFYKLFTMKKHFITGLLATFAIAASAQSFTEWQNPEEPELTERDFYELEIGSAGIMRGYMAHPCDAELTLEKKLRLFFTMSLRAYNVPEEEIGRVIRFVEGLDIRTISEQVMQKLFKALAMHYEFSLQGIM